MNPRPILLTGANGQIGFELRRSLAALGEIIAVDHAQCDLADAESLQNCLAQTKPRLIVNAAAYTAVDKAESDPKTAFAVNAKALETIGAMAKKLGAFVIHYSTDYVFDGQKSDSYAEDDAPHPLGVYGQSKLAGEIALQQSGAKHLILRTSWVFGAHGGNFLKTMLRLAQERDTLGVVADQHGAPTGAALLADLAALLAFRQQQSPESFPYGLYHAAAAGETTWHGYAAYVFDQARQRGIALKLPANGLKAIATADYATPAQRPANSRLDCRKLEAAFGLQLPKWQAGVDQVLAQIF